MNRKTAIHFISVFGAGRRLNQIRSSEKWIGQVSLECLRNLEAQHALQCCRVFPGARAWSSWSARGKPLERRSRAGLRVGGGLNWENGSCIAAHSDLTDGSGRRRIVRHGHSPEREIQTGIGAVRVRSPRVRDRDPDAPGGRIRFTSSILPPYLRRANSVEELLPWL